MFVWASTPTEWCEGVKASALAPTGLEIDMAGKGESAGSCVDQPIKLSLRSRRFAMVHTLTVILSSAQLDNQLRQRPL